MKKIKFLSILVVIGMCVSLFAACDLSGLVNGMIPEDGNTNETNRNEGGESTEKEIHVHVVVIDDRIPPTCTEPGKTRGTYCATCGAILSGQELIPPTGHELDEFGQCIICGEYFAETTEPWWEENTTEAPWWEYETVYEPETTEPWWEETESDRDEPWWEYETREPTVELAYDLNDEGNGYIVYDIGEATDKDIVIPSEYNGLPVVKIDTKAFEGYDITSVYIPDTVKEIGRYAFNNCYNLRSVYIPGTVESMGEGAFSSCSSLKEVTLGAGIKAIPNNAFSYSYSLREITIPDSVKSIDSGAFWYCSNLEMIIIGNGSRLESISRETFGGCDNLQYNTYSNASYLGSEDNPYLILVKANNQKIRSCEIHSQTKVIAGFAFEGCFSIKTLEIPDGVIGIGAYAFSGCSSLESVTMPLVGKKIENGLEIDMRFCEYFGWNVPETLKTVVINGGERIGEHAFSGCSGLTSITIPDGVTSIGTDAFYNCSGLTSVTIPDGVTSIGTDAFYNCSGLTSVTIPDGVTSISNWAFSYCSGLTSITIPDGVTSIGEGAFSYCSELTSITIPDGMTSIGAYAFQSCSGLTSVTIPESVTSICEWAFSACGNLTDIYFGGSEAEWKTLTSDYNTNLGAYNATVHFADEEATDAEEIDTSAE